MGKKGKAKAKSSRRSISRNESPAYAKSEISQGMNRDHDGIEFNSATSDAESIWDQDQEWEIDRVVDHYIPFQGEKWSVLSTTLVQPTFLMDVPD